MEATLSAAEGLSFTLQGDEALAFSLEDTSITFALNDDEHLQVSLDDAEALTFGLGDSSDIAVGLETPTVVGVEYYDESYEVTPKTYEQKLETKRKFLTDDITILEIPYFETSNDSDGMTVYIANTMA